MRTLDQIKVYKERYIKELYLQTREAQKTDDTYINDTFKVPEVKNPHHLYRSGLGVRIIDAPAEQIITSNPQAFFEVIKGAKDVGEHLSEIVNAIWLDILRRQNPNIFKESVKNPLARGETYIKLAHNESWVTGGNKRLGLPVHFLVLDPMVIYGSPEEDVNGIPERVIVFYERQLSDVIVRYPNWSNPKKAEKGENPKVEWFEYWDSETKYIEADEEPILDGGIQPNIYGFPPFVRKYSGFGRRSPDGELANLIVSDIRRSRDLLREECAMRSNIASVMYLYAHKPKTLIVPPGTDIENLKEEFSLGSYDINVIQADPAQIKIVDEDIVPSPEMFTHYQSILSQLNQRHPFILPFPMGSSGRQDVGALVYNLKRYDTVVENTENLFATAIEQALKIVDAVPSLIKGTGLRQGDLDAKIKCNVKLKAADPLEEDRRITLGNRLWNSGKGSISLQRFHTEFQGMTEAESKKEIAKMLADQVTIYNPDIAAVMGMVAAKEGGMEEYLAQLQEQRKGMEGTGMREELPRTGEERIQGEVETPFGGEESVSRGARRPPAGYTRG